MHSVQKAIITKQVGESEEVWIKKKKRMTDGRCGEGKRGLGLSLTIARDSEVMCAKAVLDV